jgi:hypothetical protein
MISSEEGKKLLQLARESIECFFESKECVAQREIRSRFSEPQGCFVTLHKGGELRGCIGFPEPVLPLHEAIVQAAQAAAFEDPRFPRLSKGEMAQIELEISVLTKPELLKGEPETHAKRITVGRDGLILRGARGSGLLLPQVAVEWKWNSQEFLEHTCHKAGLGQDAWKSRETKVYTFQAQIFSEKGKTSRKA